MSFYESLKRIETSTPSKSVKASITSNAIQTDLTYPNAENKCKKVSDLKKTTTNKQKLLKNQLAESRQVSLDSRNPSNGLSGEPGPSKSNRRKDRLKKIV